MSDVSLRAILEADVKGFQSAMKQAGDSMREAADGMKKAFGGMGEESENTTKNMFKNFETAGDGMADIGKKMTLGITTPLMAGATASVKAFSDMESAMAGVQKTTDMTDAEIAKMKGSLQDMSSQAPIAATELAGIAEAAGQLGIENDNILSFTETIAMLGTATNMAGEEAATSLARFANITQMSQTDFDRLGSTIVELGNNLATTESEIVNMGLRLAGTGAQIGLTEPEIMGLAAAMSSVGIEAEAGGSAMSQTLKKMDAAVRESGAELETYASVAGVTSEEFAQAWQENPTEAITAFIDGLGGMIERGEDTNSVLADLGITGIRETDTLLRLAGAAGLIGESFDMANGAWEENTALSEEAATAWDTMASKTQMLWNQIVNLSEAIGEKLAPYIEKAIDAFSGFLDALSGMDDGVINFIIVLGGMAAALGPVLLVGGKLLAFIGKFGTAIQTAGSLLGGLSSMFPAVAAGFKLIAGAIGAVIGFLGPVGIVIAVIGALIAVLVVLWNTNEGFRDAVTAIWESIVDIFVNAGTAIAEALSSAWTSISETAISVWTSISGFFAGIWTGVIETTTTAWTGITEFLSGIWTGIIEAVTTFFAPITEMFSEVWNSILEITMLVWESIKAFVAGVFLAIVGILTGNVGLAVEAVSKAWGIISDNTRQVFEAVGNIISTVFSSISSFVSGIVSGIASAVSSAWNSIKSFTSSTWNSIKSATTSAWNTVRTSISTAVTNIRTTVSTGFQNVVSAVTSAGPRIVSAVRSAFNNAISAARSFISQAVQVGRDIISGFVNGIKAAAGRLISAVTGAVRNAIDAAKNLLGIGSPSKVFKEFGGWTMEGFEIGVNKNADRAENAVVDVMDNIVKLADYMDLNPAVNIIPMVDAQAIEQIAVNDGIVRTEQQVNKAINHNMNTAKQPAIINLSLGRRDYDFFVEDVTEAQDRKEAIERRKR